MRRLAPSDIFLFEDFRLDRRGLFRRNDSGAFFPVAIGSRALDLLGVLIERAGEVVAKDEIIAAVWPETVVEDNNLTVQISALRRVLDHGRSNPSSIQTLSGRGYRLVTPVTRCAPDSAEPFVPTANARLLEPQLPSISSAERRQLTVMICDLVGATALSSQLDPEDLREIIAAYQRAVSEAVSDFDGLVVKYMVEGVLAFFGYPRAHEDDVERAVRAGLEVIAAVGRLDAKPVKLQVQVGIATGLVVVGDPLGEGSAQEQSVVGEAPHLAARLKALAEPDTLLVSDGTHRLIGTLFEYRDLGPVEVNGAARPVRAWRVLRPSVLANRFEALRGSVLSPLIGRDEEIDLLLRRWARAKAGDGQLVLVCGEPGIGKSRIAAELEERLKTDPRLCLRCFCSPYHQNRALFPFIDQLGRAAGFRHGDLPATRLEKLETLLARTAPADDDLALLADLLSLPACERHPLPDLSAQRKKERTLEALIRQIEGLARQQPVLMIFEDAHWVDPSSRELLDLAAERIRSLPVLLIVTFRPEFQPPWIGEQQVMMLTLNRLDHRDRMALVEQIAGSEPLPDWVVDQVAERTDGIPLFIEELTKSVLESGLLCDKGDRYVLDGALPPFAIPASLHDSLMARLDRLGPAAREVAQLGAVLGREFSYELAHQVAHRPDLDTVLEQLTGSGLLFCRGVPPRSSYLFKHTLVQEAAYGTLLRGRKKELHTRAAAVLERQFGELTESQPELVARHYTEAGETDQAVVWWQKAGQRAVRLSGNTEAVAYFGRAVNMIGLLPESRQRDLRELEIRIELGTALFGTRGYAATELAENYARAWTLCERSGSTEHALAVLWGQYLAEPPGKAFMPGQTNKAERFLKLAQRHGDAGLQVVGHRMLGACLVSEGKFVVGQCHLECGMALYDWEKHRGLTVTFGAINPRISCLATLSLVLQYLGYPDQAAKSGDQAVEEARRLGHFNTLGVALHLVGRFRAFRREQEQVRILAGELLALSRKHGSAEWELVAEILLGWQEARAGDLQRGLESVRCGTSGLRARNPYHLHLPAYLLFEAELNGEAGRYEEELRLLNTAHDVMDMQGQFACEAELYRLRGSALLARGAASGDIERCYERSAEIARRQSAKFWELRTAVSRARFWRDQGKCTAARDMLASVYRWFTEGFETQVLKEAKALLDELEGVAST